MKPISDPAGNTFFKRFDLFFQIILIFDHTVKFVLNSFERRKFLDLDQHCIQL